MDMIKTYADTYLYRKFDKYEKNVFAYLMNSKIIDKSSEQFQDAIYEVKKRAVSNAFVECMKSDNVVFLFGEVLQPFSVVAAKDLRRRATRESATQNMILNDYSEESVKAYEEAMKDTVTVNGKEKLMAEDTNFVPFTVPYALHEEVAIGAPLKIYVQANFGGAMDEKGKLKNPEVFISLLNSAITHLLYYKRANSLFANYNVSATFGECFMKLAVHVMDYICKISVMGNTKQKAQYLTTKYCYETICGMHKQNAITSGRFTQSVSKRVAQDCELSEREVQLIDANVPEEAYTNIKTFIESTSDYLRLPGLMLDNFVEKWMYMYGGARTAFGLEYYPTMSQMLTDAYNGAYLNNQKTIEKICGQSLVLYNKAILSMV